MLDSLLNELFQRESSEFVFNQYKDITILNNLKQYFLYLLRYNPHILLIGEAPGYKGCKLTGIPFTSGNIIRNSEHKIFKEIGNGIVLHKIISENTATILWDFLYTNKIIPILWNAFPFHPHQNGILESNRKPNMTEIEEGKIFLKIVYDLFKPTKLCSLGRVGETILNELFPREKIIYIRHPSYGGEKDFIKGMQNLYNSHFV